jgi:phosphate transport system protein
MHIRERFQAELNRLRDDIMMMASRVEEELQLALTAYDRLDHSAAASINDLDRVVNKTRFRIEDECFTLIATQQPTASDLRQIVAAMNIIVDLERMGDQAKGIVKALTRIQHRPVTNRPPEIRQMGHVVMEMLQQAKTAYSTGNVELARVLSKRDDDVDSLYARAFTQIMYRMADATSPQEIEVEYELLRIARELERFGDLVTNVAERAIFLVTGNMIEINSDLTEQE